MKSIILFFILVFFLKNGVCQTNGNSNESLQKNALSVNGNNNHVTNSQIIHVNKYIFNLNDKKQEQDFFNYLNTFPIIKKYLQQMFAMAQETNYNAKETNDNVKELLKILTVQSTKTNVFNPDSFKIALDEYKNANIKLREDFEMLRKQTTNVDFSNLLIEANKRLEKYDNTGYQVLLEDYKNKTKNKLNELQKELANTSYLQAINNKINFKYALALDQINEALEYDKENVNYLFLKSEILFLSAEKKPYSREKLDESLNTFLKVVAFSQNDTLISETYFRIGLVYRWKVNREKVIEYYLKSLAIKEKIFGEENSRTIGFYNTIGDAYREGHNYDKAMEYYSKSLVLNEKIFGKMDRRTANSYNDVGWAYLSKHDCDNALEYYGKALAISEKIFDKDDLNRADSYRTIATFYYYVDDYDNAIEYYSKALVIYEKIVGDKHDASKMIFGDLGPLLIAKGEKEKGLDYLQKWIYPKSLYDKSEVTGISEFIKEYGNNSLKNNKYQEAINIFQLIFELLEKGNAPKTDPIWATTAQNMANSYCYLGKKDKAVPLFEKALLYCKDTKKGVVDIERIKKDYEECNVK